MSLPLLDIVMPSRVGDYDRRIAATIRLVLQNNVQSVDDTREVTKDGQQDVDEEVSAAATLEEDTDGRENDGKNDLADIGGGERHVD